GAATDADRPWIAHPVRTACCRNGERRDDGPEDRADVVRDGDGCEVSAPQRLRQARRALARRAIGRTRPVDTNRGENPGPGGQCDPSVAAVTSMSGSTAADRRSPTVNVVSHVSEEGLPVGVNMLDALSDA